MYTIFNLYQQYRHSIAVPSVTNAQGQYQLSKCSGHQRQVLKGPFTKLTIVHISSKYLKKKNNKKTTL